VPGHPVMTYQALFERADDGSVFAYVPDLRGCTSWGPTLDDARERVREAIAMWVAVARDQRVAPPPTTTIASESIPVPETQ
jgi:predicted RNase H-like HicB family nuclease